MKKDIFLKGGISFWLLIFGVVSGALIWGCATATRPNPPTGAAVSGGTNRLTEICSQYHWDCSWDPVTRVITMKSARTEIKALAGSPLVLWSQQSILLNQPIRLVQSEVIVPPDFQQKVLDRIFPAPAVSMAARRVEPGEPKITATAARQPLTVILDPGHGGKDPGAISPWGLKEKNIVLDISRRVKEELENEGFRVILLRSGDVFVSLERRTEIVSMSRADLFVSIHANSHPSRSINGIEVYALRELTPSEKREEQRAQNEQTFFHRFKMARNLKTVAEIISDMLYAFKESASHRLANDIGKQTGRAIHASFRGVKTCRFFVLRNTLIPAALVEVGFLTNPREEKLLRQADYRQKIADGITQGIGKYVKE
ncbi:MAG: N-acetylmuramoyl-L-alanine amidase [Candidatus Omnitrophica bacterium]|nr:N-acetylmuramoyl-L-alanine amidase [Candidatus Omnitrophota bacterium]